MTFSPEDKRVWDESEVMNEFEKIAEGIFDEAEKSLQPIQVRAEQTDNSWEDEEDPNLESVAELLINRLNNFGTINKELSDSIKTISYSLADRGLKKEAFLIERAVKDFNRRNL